MKFEGINSPRIEDGGFGPESCSKCGVKTTAYLRIMTIIEKTNLVLSIDLCSGCLYEGISIIGKTILDDCIKKGELKDGLL